MDPEELYNEVVALIEQKGLDISTGDDMLSAALRAICTIDMETKEISMEEMLAPNWPEVFTNPDFEYDESDLVKTKAKACADGIVGWMLHNATKFPHPPEHFNLGLSKIRIIVGVATRLDALRRKGYELGLPNSEGIGCDTCTKRNTKHCERGYCYTRDYVMHTTMNIDHWE